MGLKAALERSIHDVDEAQNPWMAMLEVPSRLYGLGVRLRSYCLEKRILPVRRLPGPVISVGNLTVGGTGKTPLVIVIAKILNDAGYRVAVLTRGYARKRERDVQRVSEGSGPLCVVDEAGDEPFMLAHRLKSVQIWVGKDRHRAGMLAWDYGSPDVFLLDDGFQHRRLDRDLDIVVIRAPKPFGNGKFLPAGPLREPPEALGRADLLIINMTFDRDRGEGVARRIASMLPSVPLLQAEYRPHRLWAWQGKEEGSLPLNAVTGQRVAVLCGIGNAKGFREMVSGLGARVVKSLFFPDHYWYTPVDITSIRRMLREVDAVITTEKDIWKLIRAGAGDEPILTLQVEFEIESVHVLKEYLRSCISATDGRPVE